MIFTYDTAYVPHSTVQRYIHIDLYVHVAIAFWCCTQHFGCQQSQLNQSVVCAFVASNVSLCAFILVTAFLVLLSN